MPSGVAATTTTLVVISSSSVWTDVTSSTIYSASKTEVSLTASFESSVALETSETATTEATTTTADSSSTTEALISAAETTTTTVEEIGPLETFAIVAYNDQQTTLKGGLSQGSIAIFNSPDSSVEVYTLTIEPNTNRLKTGAGNYLCASRNEPTVPDQPGVVGVCNTDYS
ncbi:hypothetical protein IL306_006594 [Fusarium sp. DS 682]|nr:hypothetical protein IL306_006594 [Fusarium sp. DS 682]